MTETSDLLVFWIVVGARFLVPLLIPRYPLPAIVAALIIDAADQTIFQQCSSLSLEDYQGYDKALDIYYLTIAYISTLRNWTNHFAFQVSRFLFYWRLVGVALFELTHLRPLLLIFPNTFEYFFIFYEVYRLRWDPARMSKRLAIGAAAVIWIVIKLPQEWWIHIAQLDTTDFVKETIFGVPIDSSWGEIIAAYPWVFALLLVLVVLIVVAVTVLARRYLPPADRKPAFLADTYKPAFSRAQERSALTSEARQIVDAALVEKIALTALVALCFAQVLPEIRATTLELLLGVAVLVTINTVVSHLLVRRGVGWAFTFWEFVVMALVNLGVFLAYALFRLGSNQAVSSTNVLFFVALLALLVTLYDHYRQVYLMRYEAG